MPDPVIYLLQNNLGKAGFRLYEKLDPHQQNTPQNPQHSIIENIELFKGIVSRD
jgi:hypothetical protein